MSERRWFKLDFWKLRIIARAPPPPRSRPTAAVTATPNKPLRAVESLSAAMSLTGGRVGAGCDVDEVAAVRGPQDRCSAALRASRSSRDAAEFI